jgi:hypothetical protein
MLFISSELFILRGWGERGIEMLIGPKEFWENYMLWIVSLL